MSDGRIEKYFLRTERLGFRWWNEGDLGLAQGLWGDLEVTRFFGGPFTDEEIEERLETEIERRETHGFQYWPIFMLANDEHVGCCGLRPYRPEETVHEMGFHLRPKFWGQGLAVEAARAVIAHAFDTIGAKGLSAGHHPKNVNSKKVMAKLGFRYDHDKYFERLGMYNPNYLMARPNGSPK
jgi:RimJ/RimL family protein N-acetyltransferase